MITLQSLPTASAQEVYNQAAKHLLTQNAQSISNVNNFCVYHGENGMKCAVGCFISDEEYASNSSEESEYEYAANSFEGMEWCDLVLKKGMPNNHMDLLEALQNLHDYTPVERWKKSLSSLALEFGLNPEVV